MLSKPMRGADEVGEAALSERDLRRLRLRAVEELELGLGELEESSGRRELMNSGEGMTSILGLVLVFIEGRSVEVRVIGAKFLGLGSSGGAGACIVMARTCCAAGPKRGDKGKLLGAGKARTGGLRTGPVICSCLVAWASLMNSSSLGDGGNKIAGSANCIWCWSAEESMSGPVSARCCPSVACSI